MIEHCSTKSFDVASEDHYIGIMDTRNEAIDFIVQITQDMDTHGVLR